MAARSGGRRQPRRAVPREIGRHLRTDVLLQRLALNELFQRIRDREGGGTELPDAVFHARCVVEVLEPPVTHGLVEKLQHAFPAEFEPLLEGSRGGCSRGPRSGADGPQSAGKGEVQPTSGRIAPAHAGGGVNEKRSASIDEAALLPAIMPLDSDAPPYIQYSSSPRIWLESVEAANGCNSRHSLEK